MKIDLPYLKDDLSYTFRIVSLFFREPVTITTPKETFQIGDGPGGFSASLFQRGFECQICSACCFGLHARARSWLPGEDAPDAAQLVECRVNGVDFPVMTYTSQRDTVQFGCDFLVPLEPEQIHPVRGTRLAVCSLWKEDGGQVPLNCRTGPGLMPAKLNTVRGQRTLLSRRLPPRNWQNPKCPVPVYDTPLDEFRIRSDRVLFRGWLKAVENLPGHFLKEAFDLYETIVDETSKGKIPTNHFFEDIFTQR